MANGASQVPFGKNMFFVSGGIGFPEKISKDLQDEVVFFSKEQDFQHLATY